MIRLELSEIPSPLRILAIGCHADDIEIGCGGTILRLIASYPSVEVCWVVLSAHGERADEVHASAEAFLQGSERQQIIVRDFRDGFLPYSGGDVKQFFEDLKPVITPDLIFTHYGNDRHQDHRLASELTWNTFRDHFILEYEVPKYDGDLGAPNVFVHLDEALVKRKVENLLTLLPDPAGSTVVHRGSLPEHPPASRHGVERSGPVRGGLLRTEGRSVSRPRR